MSSTELQNIFDEHRLYLVGSKSEEVVPQKVGAIKICPGLHTYNDFFFMATPAAYRNSLARGSIGAAASGLHHSHSDTDLNCICHLTTDCSNTKSLTH